MKNSEFILNFNNLSNDNIIRDQVFTLKIPSEKFEITYDLIGLHKFVEEQSSSWNDLNINPNQKFKDSLNFFSRLLTLIESSVSNTKTTLDINREIQK